MSTPLHVFDESIADADVAQAVIDGVGEPAEAALVARFNRRVFLYGMRHLREEAKADDLAQEVLLTTIARLRAGEVKEPARIASFVLGTARWTVGDMRRRERRADEVANAAAHEQEQVAYPQEAVDTDALVSALAALSERERAVVVLSFHQDQSAQQIADALGLEAGHVRVIRHRAIARLAALMGVNELTEDRKAP